MSNEEGNKLIAEFMQLKKLTDTTWINPVLASSTPELNYHASWGWLMPVIEKIGNIPFEQGNGWTEEDYIERNAYPYPRTFGMKTKEGKYMVRLNACPSFEADTLIEAAWLAVVDYIQYTPATETSANPENKK